jgi:sortase B
MKGSHCVTTWWHNLPEGSGYVKKIERIIMALCFLVLLLCSRYLLDYCLDSLENRQTYQQVEDIAFPQDDDDVERGNTEGEDTEQAEDFDFQALLAENADCIGWLSIPGTDISYPVVQGTDNEYYLHHDFYKNVASCGTLFLDYRNDLSRQQEHLIIYGHQMKDGSMFKQLNSYKEESFYQEHQSITLYLEEQKYQYEVAAIYVTSVAKSGDYYNYLHKETRNKQKEYLQGMAAYQLYDTGVTVHETDELLSLSTCEYSSTNGRLIVLARRI